MNLSPMGKSPPGRVLPSLSAEVKSASKIEHLRSLLLLNLVLGHYLKIFEAENMNVSIKLCSVAGSPFDSLHSTC